MFCIKIYIQENNYLNLLCLIYIVFNKNKYFNEIDRDFIIYVIINV